MHLSRRTCRGVGQMLVYHPLANSPPAQATNWEHSIMQIGTRGLGVAGEKAGWNTTIRPGSPNLGLPLTALPDKNALVSLGKACGFNFGKKT